MKPEKVEYIQTAPQICPVFTRFLSVPKDYTNKSNTNMASKLIGGQQKAPIEWELGILVDYVGQAEAPSAYQIGQQQFVRDGVPVAPLFIWYS